METRAIAIFGRDVAMPRLTAWYGDEALLYVLASPERPIALDAPVSELRDAVAARLRHRFNSVLLNRYRSGRDGVSWHSDDEPELGDEPVIASLSFGATRRFLLRDRSTRERAASLELEHGSLLVMRGRSQRVFQHCVPKDPRATGERINLTFRDDPSGPLMADFLRDPGTRRFLRNVNWPLAVSSVLIACIGIVSIQSADLHAPEAAGEFHKQILYAVLGVPLMIGVALVDYRNWQRWAPALYVLNLALLLFILRGGHSALGAQRWISLGPLGTFQPSEPAKLVLAIALAAVLCRDSYGGCKTSGNRC